MSDTLKAIVALAGAISAALGAKKDNDQAKKDETQRAIDGAKTLPPPPKEN